MNRFHVLAFIYGWRLLSGVAMGAEREAAVALEPVSVSANVPLTKVGEFHLLQPRWAAAAVAKGDFIYVIGGDGSPGGAAMDSIERFNIKTGKSEPFAKLSTARRQHGAVLVGDKIYVIGGRSTYGGGGELRVGRTLSDPGVLDARVDFRGGGTSAAMRKGEDWIMQVLASVEVVDTVTGRVTPGPAMLDARAAFGCVILGDQIYVIGGDRRQGLLFYTNRTQILDLKTGTWREGVPMPYAAETAAVAVDGFIVVAGGYDSRRVYDSVAALSPDFERWRALPPLVKESSAHAMVFLGHSLFLFGSYDRPWELIAYDLKPKESEVFTLRYTAARHTAAVTVGDRIYVIGGKMEATLTSVDLVQVFELTEKMKE